MNKTLGKYASLVLLISTIAFAASMVIGFSFGNFFFSMAIAWSFVATISAFCAYVPKERRAAAITGVAFAAMYAVMNTFVYFTQLTTVRQAALTEQATALLDFGKFGLLFNIDIFGYGYMSLATFFIGLTMTPATKEESGLKALLMIHGVFFLSCTAMPLLGLFRPGMEGGELVGALVLLVWCAYFAPVAWLSCRFFARQAA